MKNIQIALIIALRDIAAGVEIGCKDECVLVDRPVLHRALGACADLMDLLEPAVQKVDLHMKCPAVHVGVEIAEVRVVLDGFKKRAPPELLRKLGG